MRPAPSLPPFNEGGWKLFQLTRILWDYPLFHGDPMAEDTPEDAKKADKQPRLTPVAAAALFGGTMAAAAGAYFGTRALARRNREQNGRPINSVMAAAITACDLAHDKQPAEARAAQEPSTPTEPST